MTSTLTLVVVTVSGILAAAPAPTWQPDYTTAAAQAVKQQKPIAVFIGSGTDGLAKVVAEGKLAADESKMLADEYVCLYVDTATDAGKKTAAAFEMTQGVVISDKTGAVQALRHEGTVAHADLTQYLTTYSAQAAAPATTEYRGTAARPVVMSAPVYAAPPPIMGSYRTGVTGRSSCPNCR